MSNYTKTTDFAAKDSLATGNPAKIVRGAEFETEFDAISTAIATKADTAGPTFTGTATFATTNATTVQIGGVAITSTAAELNLLDGVTATTAEINLLDGVTATTAELNILDGVTATAVEINLLDGVTATTAELNILDGVTSTATELNLLDGITGILDEDNMASDSATALATQQSIKAYVDTTVAATNEVVEDTTPQLGGDLDTNGNNILFADNDKAIFGAGSDLQIYHNGSNSYIDDAGTGSLVIRSNAVNIGKYTGETAAVFTADGSVQLRYDNSAKLETTNTGIDVTGSVVSDGATIAGTLELDSNNFDHTAATPQYNMIESDVTGENTQLLQSAGLFRIRTVDDSLANPVERFRIDHSTGDVSFFGSVAGNRAFHWDSSTNRLGLGTVTPAATLHIKGPGGCEFHMESGDGASTSVIKHNQSTDALEFYPDGSLAMTLQAGNQAIFESNVGIGTTSPSTTLHVLGSAQGSTDQVIFESNNGGGSFGPVLNLKRSSASPADNDLIGMLKFTGNNSAAEETEFARILTQMDDVTDATEDGSLIFSTMGGGSISEALRIDSSQNVLIGNTDTDPATNNVNGVAITAGGEVIASLNGVAAQFNRRTSDGDVAVFKKGGDTKGSIGILSSRLYIGSGDTGIKFSGADDLISPIDASDGTGRDAAIDLGSSSTRFKDLYLSGGLYVGGTGSPNKLEDYEEGSFAMSLHDAASGGNQSSTSKTAYYTKIGNQVTVYVYAINNIDTTGMTAGNSLYFALPFTAGGVGRAVGSVIHHGFTYDGNSDYEDMKPYVATGSSRGLFATVGYGIADSSVKVSDVSSGVDDIHTLTLTYFVA